VAYRTIDKSKRRGARALASLDSSAETPGAETEEQQPSMEDEDRPELQSDPAALGADEGAAEDTDLRIPTSALAVRQPARPPVSPGLNVPPWVMANPVTRYLAESALELMKVTWPTRRSAWNSTLVVICMSAVVAVLLGAADFGLTHLVGVIVNLSGPPHITPTPTPGVPLPGQ
jgi:preprotein translocase SecE subunit